MNEKMKKRACIIGSTFMLASCSKATRPNENVASENSNANEAKLISTPEATPPSENREEDTIKSLYGTMQCVLPEGWEVVATGDDNPYDDRSSDYLGIQNGEKRIELLLYMEAPAGIGYEPDYDETIEPTRIGDDEYTGGISNSGTCLTLETMLFENPEHGGLFVYLTDSNGASTEDEALNEVLESLEIKDSFGTVTINADEINIISGKSNEDVKVGIAKKGETYKVYSKEKLGEYTWYNIGYLEYIADKDGEWITYTENN